MSRDKDKPTPAQVAFFGEIMALVKRLGTQAARARLYRHGTPEQVAIAFLSSALPRVIEQVKCARTEGRQLELRWDRDCVPSLVLLDPPAQVIPIAPYLAAKRGGARG
ncbi:hypothetical protein [Sorangium sp. So ce145]|uniref:hypothetical protein n=1 Tax=Sorangium sp. So ce145 TaxID=3133285 RepID=UPI003F616B49